MKRLFAWIVVLACLFESVAWPAIDQPREIDVRYVEGTDEILLANMHYLFPMDTTDKAVFGRSPSVLEIPYNRIVRLAYGQRVTFRRRAVLGIAAGFWFFFLKNRRQHFLREEYMDPGGTRQYVTFEVGKKHFWVLADIMQFRSGKRLDFLDQDAQFAAYGLK